MESILFFNDIVFILHISNFFQILSTLEYHENAVGLFL